MSVTVTGTATGAQNNTTSPPTAGGPVPLTGTPSNTAVVTVTGASAPPAIPVLDARTMLLLVLLLGAAGARLAKR